MYDLIDAPHGPLAVDEPTDRTPATARAYTVHVLDALGIPAEVITDVTERARVIASELVTNVFAHTDGPMELEVYLSEDGGSVVIEVTDHAAASVPELGLPAADLLAEHGYGLYLTSAFADSVFEYPTADGKVIGAVINLPAPRVYDNMADLLRDLDGAR